MQWKQNELINNYESQFSSQLKANLNSVRSTEIVMITGVENDFDAIKREFFMKNFINDFS